MRLRLDNIHAYYGASEALRGVSLEINEGEIVCLLGANGAGKTTLLRTISGLLRLTSGMIEFDGKRLENLPPDAIVKLGISQCPEGRKIFPDMSVLKNLMLGAYIRRGDRKGVSETLEEVFQLFPILEERQKQLAGTLSGGEQQMLTIGRGLMSKPKLFLLDEPSLGLAPVLVSHIFEKIRDINQKGTAVFLVEQNAAVALSIAHRGYVMETGQIALADTSQNLLGNEKVIQAYLGA